MEESLTYILSIATFGFIALGAQEIGRRFSRIRLPLITGFLFAGILAGPYCLKILSQPMIASLGFVDDLALAFIAFAAGSELYLKELRQRLRSISLITGLQLVTIFGLGSIGIYFMAGVIPFMAAFSASQKWAVALLISSILIARSPSSAIATIKELRAKGPFTQTLLGVTVIIDFAVVVCFSLSLSIAGTVFHDANLDLTFILVVVAELAVACLLGFLLAKSLAALLGATLHSDLRKVLLLLLGGGTFWLCHGIHAFILNNWGLTFVVEPLLPCMIGAFWVANFSRHRQHLASIIHSMGPAVYVAFFTLVGASLNLPVITDVWHLMPVLILLRVVAIFFGSYLGGKLAGDPEKHNRLSWMGHITQAGVGLGLAQELALAFPVWGKDAATIIIAMIVINQLIGPTFLKTCLILVGETHRRAQRQPIQDTTKDALIFGLETQSLALARQLVAHAWQVKVITTKTLDAAEVDANDIPIVTVASYDLPALKGLRIDQAEAIVCMETDQVNLGICEAVYEHFGTPQMVVRLQDQIDVHRFKELGAQIVIPSTAMTSLLDHIVRSPGAASLLLGEEQDQDVMDIEVRNAHFHGQQINDIRFPLDTHIISIHRRGALLAVHGFVKLKLRDQISIVGPPASLQQVELLFGE